MEIKFILIILLYISLLTGISCYYKHKLIPLSNSDYLVIHKEGIFHFKNKFAIPIKTFIIQNNEQNISDIDNIFHFKCFEENICMIIDNSIYVFTYEGTLEKIINLPKESLEGNNIFIPLHNLNNDSNFSSAICTFS